MHRRNAKITSATIELHGQSLTSIITVSDGGNVSQGFGGLRLMAPTMPRADRMTSDWIVGILLALGLESWDEVVGQHVRIESDTETGPLNRIGHIMRESWFDIRDFRLNGKVTP